jgi:hypothetical protein
MKIGSSGLHQALAVAGQKSPGVRFGQLTISEKPNPTRVLRDSRTFSRSMV